MTPLSARHQDVPVEEPFEALEGLCAALPSRAEPRIVLADALLRAGRPAEAVVYAEQAAALAPGLASALEVREAVLTALYAGDPNLVALELAAVVRSADADAQLALAEAYAALDRPHDAELRFKRALALGRGMAAHSGLSRLYLSVAMVEAAEHHATAALAGPDAGPADDAFVVMAHQTLAGVAEQRGDHAACVRHLDQAYNRQSLFRQPAADCAFTTLVLLTREAGNIDYRALVPPLRFDCALWYMEHARQEQWAELPPHAVVLNAIGDPDHSLASRAAVDAFLAHCGRPVVNPPARIAATFRHRLGETLAGIADVITPATARFSAASLAEPGLRAAASAAGLKAPLIVRPVGSHGGAGMALAPDEPALDEIGRDLADRSDVYVSKFHDYRSMDGNYRKYRVIFVDRRAYPYHVAIGRHWMVHHQTTDMDKNPEQREEELQFLRDPAGVIGARAMAAIEAIGRRLDLDYGGVDFTVTRDGQVLVFEANATMLAHVEPEDGPFAAKNPFIRPIAEAFQARLAALAAGGSIR